MNHRRNFGQNMLSHKSAAKKHVLNKVRETWIKGLVFDNNPGMVRLDPFGFKIAYNAYNDFSSNKGWVIWHNQPVHWIAAATIERKFEIFGLV